MLSRRKFAALAGAAVVTWPVETSAAKRTGVISGRVTITRGRRGKQKSDHSGVVIYLEGVRGSLPVGQSHEIRQVNRHFVPVVSVVTVGTTLTFPNDDKIFHNVFSNSKAATFDLGSYDQGETKSVRLKKNGQVEVYCNIHQEMRATVLVLDTVHYGTTEKGGNFVIKGVPVGTHRYVAWQRDSKPVTGKVTVVEDAIENLELTVREGRPKRHRRKGGHVYDPY